MNKGQASGHILTYTGVTIDPLHPDPDCIRIEDIAHSLSMLCRANGHFRTFHSVAQHCIECYEEAKARGLSDRVQSYCFLHDAAEAYLGDFVSPVKYRMDDYRDAEDRLLNAVYRKFTGGVPTEEEEKQVKTIDHTLLYYEFLELMGRPVGDVPSLPLQSDQDFRERNWKDVEKDFIELFNRITRENCRKACIFFDVDDTLYDQRDAFYCVYREMFEDRTTVSADEVYLRSMKYNEEIFDQIQSGAADPYDVIRYRVSRALKDYGIPFDEREADRFRDRYLEVQRRLRLSPVMERILDLCRNHFLTGIITNGAHDHQYIKINALGVERRIPSEYILISADTGYAKPETGIFREAERRTGASPEEMIYVGDSYDRDMAGAINAGWKSIWMNRRKHPLPDGAVLPDYEVHTEEGLEKLIRTLIV